MSHALKPMVCVFVKAPEPGLVKTRLAASIGPVAAAELASAFIVDTVELVRRIPSVRLVIALSGAAGALPKVAKDLTRWDQGTGDLGTRLERCSQRALAESPAVIVIGTDSPGMPSSLLYDALRALESHDAVLGPADDGGFYLLGLKRCPLGLLSDLPWSAENTCSRTAAQLREFQLAVAFLAPWFDVDDEQGCQRLRGLLASGAISASQSAKVLGL